jgi:hypothetical protein
MIVAYWYLILWKKLLVAAIAQTHEELTEKEHGILVGECKTIPSLLQEISKLENTISALNSRAKVVNRGHKRTVVMLEERLRLSNGSLKDQNDQLQRRIDYLILNPLNVNFAAGHRCVMSTIHNRPTGPLMKSSNDCWLLKSRPLEDNTEDPLNRLCTQPHKRQATNICMCTYEGPVATGNEKFFHVACQVLDDGLERLKIERQNGELRGLEMGADEDFLEIVPEASESRDEDQGKWEGSVSGSQGIMYEGLHDDDDEGFQFVDGDIDEFGTEAVEGLVGLLVLVDCLFIV